MTLGFERAGFDVVAGFDNWKAAIRVYGANFQHPVIEQDLMNVDEAITKISEYKPDMIIGGPPCQDFSTAGFQDETRGRAILSVCYSQIVCAIRPKYFVMENVATIRNTDSFRKVIENFTAAGYGLTKMVLDAAYCGVPQTRKRMFVIGVLNSENGFLEEELRKNLSITPMSIHDYLGDSLGIDYYFRVPTNYNRIAAIVIFFSEIYLGHRTFNYDECHQKTKELMEMLAQEHPEIYSGITDPLPAIYEVALKNQQSDKTEESNEEAFKCWLAKKPKANGELYSENTQSQYMGALRGVAVHFAEMIIPYTSLFEITDTSSFDRVISVIKNTAGFEEYNRNRGNGSLAAGLDLYRRYLLELNEQNKMFSPGWFRAKAAEYPTLDAEANRSLADFQDKFAPDTLASLSGIEMLNTIFLNATNPENVCRILEFGPQIKDTFGSIKGGNAYKYGLYYSTQGAWMTGSHQKPRQLTEEEAVEVGTKLRDHLVTGANAIKEYGPLATIDDYKKLHQILHEVTEGDIERVWFLKYYQMLFPELFATNYSDYAQRTVLGAIGEEKEKYPFVRMGQIRFYANKCGISNVMFNKIFWDYYTEEATVAKAEPSQDICYRTGYQSSYPRNRILFGAPGTGKSFTLNHEKGLLLAEGGEYERVTFHPDYSYANFVGTYKPVPCQDSDGKDAITYSYVPGPFMRTYVKALQNSRTDAPKPFLLVIEEINRANVAAVFGDVFQLLDRGDDEVAVRVSTVERTTIITARSSDRISEPSVISMD